MAFSADISVLGPGKVGTTLAVLAARAGLHVAVAGRRADQAAQAAAQAGAGASACSLDEAAAAAPLVLLTVSDSAISRLCLELAQRRSFSPACVVAHCSGLLDSAALAPARVLGCRVGSLHPLASFPSVDVAVAAFAGTWCFVEGDAEAVWALERLAGRLGAARCLTLPPGRKPLYHAAAVMACNYLAGLMDAAAALAGQAGIDPDQALPALEALVRGTVDNVFSMGPAAALTGPITRGDAQAVRMHLEAMRDLDPGLRALYLAAGRWTVQLARKKGSISQQQARDLQDVLGEGWGLESLRSERP